MKYTEKENQEKTQTLKYGTIRGAGMHFHPLGQFPDAKQYSLPTSFCHYPSTCLTTDQGLCDVVLPIASNTTAQSHHPSFRDRQLRSAIVR